MQMHVAGYWVHQMRGTVQPTQHTQKSVMVLGMEARGGAGFVPLSTAQFPSRDNRYTWYSIVGGGWRGMGMDG